MIHVIDAPCGVGKTSWAIQDINNHPDESYIFCTPFLEEISRIRENCGKHRFFEPLPYEGTKIDNFNELLSEGADIAVTHTTFLNATDETMELIRTGDYTLIIDESLDVIQEFNKTQTVADFPEQITNKADIELLINNNIIKIQHDYKVVWCDKEYNGGKNSEVERFSKLGRLYCVGNELLLVVFPPEIFDMFKNVYVLTYMFDGSYFKYYLELFNIPYDLKSVCQNEAGLYSITPYSQEADKIMRETCKQLITIYDDKELNNYRTNALSKTWYQNARKKDRMVTLRKQLRRYFEKVQAKGVNNDIMWTTYSSNEKDLKGKGYTEGKKLTDEERNTLSKSQQTELINKRRCFVPCNARASNQYQDRWALAYCINLYPSTMLRRFFTDHNQRRLAEGLNTICPNDNMFALSGMIQWIFRSQIRKGKPIVIYIPSKRMRELLISWMNNQI